MSLMLKQRKEVFKMKKILFAVCFALISSVMSVNVMAEPSGFVSSPTNNFAPVVVSGENADADCEGEVIITPYSEREYLVQYETEIFEQAYNEIKNSDRISSLNSGISDFAKSKEADENNLSVSDLFFVDYTNCTDHNDHEEFRIKLQTETLNGFVMLLHKNDDEWEIIEDAFVEDGEYLHFSAATFGPYAIVVDINANAAEASISNRFPWLYIILLVVAVAGLVVLFSRSKKNKGINA